MDGFSSQKFLVIENRCKGADYFLLQSNRDNVRVMNGTNQEYKMGQNNTLPRQRRISFRSPFLRRSKIKHSLSHTFTFLDDGIVPELLNINFATEEELMTLPGITRNVAKSIVEHRKAIGRFKKVEDLALVRGIGADRLELIRPEICASKNLSSSRVPSVDSLKSTESCGRFNKLVNINKATVFELQCVQGISQEMAASIVLHRTKKGPFKQVRMTHDFYLDTMDNASSYQYVILCFSKPRIFIIKNIHIAMTYSLTIKKMKLHHCL